MFCIRIQGSKRHFCHEVSKQQFHRIKCCIWKKNSHWNEGTWIGFPSGRFYQTHFKVKSRRKKDKKIWNLPHSIWRHKFIRIGTLTESHLSSAFLPILASRCSKEIVLWEIFTGDPILVCLCGHLMMHAHTWTDVTIIFFWEYA